MLDYEAIRGFAEAIIEDHDGESMEAVLYTDGENAIRQCGSWGPHEDEVMLTIPLGNTWWSESYIWGEDLEEDEELAEAAIGAVVEDIYYGIQEWQAQQEELKKMREYFEEERKAYEDMIVL